MSYGKGTKKDGTELIKVRVRTDVADFLRAKAKHAEMPVTELGGALLEYAAQAEANDEGAALVLPTVRQVVRQELNLFLERIFDFQVRTYMEAGTARRMVQAIAYYSHELTPLKGAAKLEKLKEYEEKQWASTWEAGRRHFDGLVDLREKMGYAQNIFENKMTRLASKDQTELEADLSAD